jgi:hypothetical protein
MKPPWLAIALGVSLLANVALVGLVMLQALDAGHYQSDQQSSWRSIAGERQQLQAMRAHFCPTNPAPTRADVLAWERTDDQSRALAEPLEKDGLLWLGVVGELGVMFGDDDRVTGVCLSNAWSLADDPSLVDQDNAGEMCPLDPLC